MPANRQRYSPLPGHYVAWGWGGWGRVDERDLRVELDAEDGVLLVRDAGIGGVRGCGNGAEARGELAQLVSVAHPVPSVSTFHSSRCASNTPW